MTCTISFTVIIFLAPCQALVRTVATAPTHRRPVAKLIKFTNFITVIFYSACLGGSLCLSVYLSAGWNDCKPLIKMELILYPAQLLLTFSVAYRCLSCVFICRWDIFL